MEYFGKNIEVIMILDNILEPEISEMNSSQGNELGLSHDHVKLKELLKRFDYIPSLYPGELFNIALYYLLVYLCLKKAKLLNNPVSRFVHETKQIMDHLQVLLNVYHILFYL